MQANASTDSLAASEPEPPQFYPSSVLKASQVIQHYLQLKPRFRLAFEKFDVDSKGFLDKPKFAEFLKMLNSGAHGKSIARYDEYIEATKDIFHREMLRTRINFENMDGDLDGAITFNELWTFLTSPPVLRRVEQQGLAPVFFFFQAVRIPSFQEEYLSLKPRIIQVFKKYADESGYISEESFMNFAEVLCANTQLTPAEAMRQFDANQDNRIGWGEFWQWFEDRTATTQEETDLLYSRIHGWLGVGGEEQS